MGFLDKMKNLFTEEEEIIEPVKKEVMHVEIKAPLTQPQRQTVETELIEEMMKPVVPEKPAPVFFDDKDFATLAKPKTKPKQVVEKRTERPVYNASKIERKERHNFKPSPIISPVYGILDKNYRKEDIVNKKNEDLLFTSSKKITIDEVRKKAFGTLEDEIDLNLNTDPLFDNENMETNIIGDSLESDIFEEMETADLPKPIVVDNDEDITLGNTDDFDLEDELENNDSYNDITGHDNEQIDESDLFNLIDSMYEKRDEN